MRGKGKRGAGGGGKKAALLLVLQDKPEKK